MHSPSVVVLTDLVDPILVMALHLLPPPRFKSDTPHIHAAYNVINAVSPTMAPTATLVSLTRHYWYIGPDQITCAYAAAPHATKTAVWLLTNMVRMSTLGPRWPRAMDYSLAGATCAAAHGHLALVVWWLREDQLLESVIHWTRVALAQADADAAALAVARKSELETIRHAAARNRHFHVLDWWLSQQHRLPVVDVEPDLIALIESQRLDSDPVVRGLFDQLMANESRLPQSVIEAACRTDTLACIQDRLTSAINTDLLLWEHSGFRPMDACASVQGLQWWVDHVPRDWLPYLYSEMAMDCSTSSDLLDWWITAHQQLKVPLRCTPHLALPNAAKHGRLNVMAWWIHQVTVGWPHARGDSTEWSSVVLAAMASGKKCAVSWCFEASTLDALGRNGDALLVEVTSGDCLPCVAVLTPWISFLESAARAVRLSFAGHAVADVSKAGRVDVLASVFDLATRFSHHVDLQFDSTAIVGASEFGHIRVLDWWVDRLPDWSLFDWNAMLMAPCRSGRMESLDWCRSILPLSEHPDSLLQACLNVACTYGHGNVLYWWSESTMDREHMWPAVFLRCHLASVAPLQECDLPLEMLVWILDCMRRSSDLLLVIKQVAERSKNHETLHCVNRHLGSLAGEGRLFLHPEDALRPGYCWWLAHSGLLQVPTQEDGPAY